MSVRGVAYHCHPDSPLSRLALAKFLAEADGSLPEPLHSRSYFTSFEDVASKFLRDGLIAYAATDSGNLAGVAVVYANPLLYPRAYETYIGVSPDWRRQGIATRLSEMEEELSRKAGASGAMTNCDPRNTAKIALNQQRGYRMVVDQEEIAAFEGMNPKWLGKSFFIKDWA